MWEEEPGLAGSSLESREKLDQFAGFRYEQWVGGGVITETVKTGETNIFGEKIESFLLDMGDLGSHVACWLYEFGAKNLNGRYKFLSHQLIDVI